MLYKASNKDIQKLFGVVEKSYSIKVITDYDVSIDSSYKLSDDAFGGTHESPEHWMLVGNVSGNFGDLAVSCVGAEYYLDNQYNLYITNPCGDVYIFLHRVWNM